MDEQQLKAFAAWIAKGGSVVAALLGGPAGIGVAAGFAMAPRIVELFTSGKDPSDITIDDLRMGSSYDEALRAGGIDPVTGKPLPGAIRDINLVDD